VNRIGSRRRLAGALVVCALVVAGCGGSSSSSGVSAAAYVKSVCTATTSWKDAIQVAGTQLQAGVSDKSLAKTKAAYVAFVGSLVSSTGSAADQLASAGDPSVANGATISSKLVLIFKQAKQRLAQAESDAGAIPTSSSTAFQTASNKVEADVRTALAGMSSAGPEKSPQLKAAAAKDATCKSLASSS
jgi:hypothetical protein